MVIVYKHPYGDPRPLTINFDINMDIRADVRVVVSVRGAFDQGLLSTLSVLTRADSTVEHTQKY